MSEVPSNWTTANIKELFEFKYGKGLTQESRNSSGSVNVYGSNGVVGKHDAALTSGSTIVVGRKGSVGEVKFSPVACWAIDTTYYIDEFPYNIPPQYWTLYLSATLKSVQNEKSSAIPGISREDIYKIEVPIPPLNEQRRIVAKLEKLLTKCEACKQRLDKIPGILKRFRQSILAAACSGRLTADWREQNPDVGWESTTLETLIKTKPRNGYSPKSVDYPTKVKSLTLTATTSGTFKPEHFKYIDEEIDENSHLWLIPGDILIQRSNTIEYVGASAIYTGSFKEFIYPDLMMKIQVIPERAKLEFIKCALSTENTRQYFRDNATGTAGNMPKINQQVVINTPVELPPLTEQKEIVQRVETLFKLADQIEQRYQKARAYVDKLPQSILAKAFRGELVPQDSNDEPASVLLERIRAEREAMQGKKAQGKQPRKQGKRTKKTTEPKQLDFPLME